MSVPQNVPVHLGLIMDGNRRWARARGLSTLEGHQLGYNNLKDITKAAINRGVAFVSAFVFSTENWNRTSKEVKYLMDLAHKVLIQDLGELNKEDIRVLWLGSPDKLSAKLIGAIKNAEASTKNNKRGTLCIGFNYGGQQELVDAAKRLIESGITSTQITIDLLARNLYKPEVPPVDLLVRTSGEHRISGYMLYRAAYAELLFVNKHWPDYNENDLDEAFDIYAKRQRRFGK